MIAKEPAVRRDNARDLLSRGQRRTVVAALLAAVLVAIAAGRSPGRLGLAAESLVGAIMVVYVVVITFKSVLVTVALREHRRYRAPVRPAHRRIPEDELPRYTVLAPVHRESAVLAQLLGNLDRLNYPRDRLEILILVEGDDEETNAALDAIALPVSFRRVVVPVSYPRTKPKACNVGLAAATGTYCVIYDAEDRPEANQLRKAVEAFEQAPPRRRVHAGPAAVLEPRHQRVDSAVRRRIRLQLQPHAARPDPATGACAPRRDVEPLQDLGLARARRLGRLQRDRRHRPGHVDRAPWPTCADDRLGHVGGGQQQDRELDAATVPMDQRLCADLPGAHEVAMAAVPRAGRPIVPVVPTGRRRHTVDAAGQPRVLGAHAGLPRHPVVRYRDSLSAAGLLPWVASMVIGNYLVLLQQVAACMHRGLYANVRWVLASFLYWALMSLAAYKAFAQLVSPHRRHYWEKTTHGLVVEHPTMPAVTDARTQVPTLPNID